MVTQHLFEDILNSEGRSVLSATSKNISLWLQGNPIGAEGLDWLTPAVAACPTLQTLQLAHIGLDVAVVQEIAAFASMLTAHEGMAKVDLFGNLIGKADHAVASGTQQRCGSKYPRPSVSICLQGMQLHRSSWQRCRQGPSWFCY